MSGSRARRAVLVVGTHRSGTSALTRVMSLLGASLPADLLPPTDDNPQGYWESQEFFELNEAMLLAAGTHWHDDASIPEPWFHSGEANSFRAKAVRLLEELFGDSQLFVLKDPRLCRLVPFWQATLEGVGISPSYLVIVRHPWEVALSLAARSASGMAGIRSHEKAHLLWLREVLTAERSTRGLNRALLTYEGLLEDWRTSVATLASATGIRFPISPDDAGGAIDAFLSPEHRHQRHTDGRRGADGVLVDEVYEAVKASVGTRQGVDTSRFRAIEGALDAVEESYGPLRDPTRRELSSASPWPAEVLARVTERAGSRTSAVPRVLYMARPREILSHSYRVGHRIVALEAAGIEADWVPLDEDAVARAERADIVVVFREPWGDIVEAVHRSCRRRGVPVGFDIDDQLFDRRIVASHFDRLRTFDEARRKAWLSEIVGGFRRTLVESDFGVFSSKPLAVAAEALGVPGYVLRNGASEEVMDQAEAALAAPPEGDGRLRLGYASGSPTHQADFETIIPVLCRLLDERPQLMLTLVGDLDQGEFPQLETHRARIETRPMVPHALLFGEVARFDVNLAPLVSNPFCESKSELKYFEAGLVGVPTVAAATLPYREAIRQGETGFTARTPDEWHSALTFLIEDEESRVRLGCNARRHAVAAFGPAASSAASRHTFQRIAEDLGVDVLVPA